MSGPAPTFFFHAGPFSEEGFVSEKEMKDVNQEYREKIRELIGPVLENEDMELVDVECLRMKTRWIVRIFMDKEGGVTLDDCADMSHQMGDLLDVHDLPPGPYILEVSSPGLDRPLARDKDFMRFRGCRVCVKADQKIDGIRNFQGILMDYLDENGKKILIVDVASKTYRIPRDFVVKAHLEQES